MKTYLADQPVDLEDFYVKTGGIQLHSPKTSDFYLSPEFDPKAAATTPISAPTKEPPVMVKDLTLMGMSQSGQGAVQLTLRSPDGETLKIICSEVAAKRHHFGQVFRLTINPLGDAND